MKCSLGISNFLERSLVFPILLFSSIYLFIYFCIDHLGRLSSLFLLFFCTLNSYGYIFPLPSFLSFFFSAICKAFSDNHLPFLLIINVRRKYFSQNIQSDNIMEVRKKEKFCMFVKDLCRKAFVEKEVFEMVTSGWDVLFKCHPRIGKLEKKRKRKRYRVRKLPTQVDLLFNWDIEYLLRSKEN